MIPSYFRLPGCQPGCLPPAPWYRLETRATFSPGSRTRLLCSSSQFRVSHPSKSAPFRRRFSGKRDSRKSWAPVRSTSGFIICSHIQVSSHHHRSSSALLFLLPPHSVASAPTCMRVLMRGARNRHVSCRLISQQDSRKHQPRLVGQLLGTSTLEASHISSDLCCPAGISLVP